MLLSILRFYSILLSTCWWSAEDYYGSFLAEGRVFQSISKLSCHLLGLWRSIRFCLSFECCWWLRRTALCAMYRVKLMPLRIFRVRVKIMPCMETFFWLNAGVLEIFCYAGLLFSFYAAFVLRLSCCWSYPRRIVSFRYSVFFSCRSPCSTQLHLTASLMNLTAYLSLKRHWKWIPAIFCRFQIMHAGN